MNTIRSGEIDLGYAIENLLPKQQQFIQSSELAVAYVGAQATGKSVVLCVSALVNALNEPNGFSLIGRLTIPALQSSTEKTFLELCPVDLLQGGMKGWLSSSHRVILTNGHEIVFRHLDIHDPKVSGHIKSMNLSAAYVDELTEITEETYFLILGRLRRKTAKVHRFRGASNPNGHDWVWRNFFGPNRKPNHVGIPVDIRENIRLPEGYVENLENIYPLDWKERFLRGSFADFSDLVYKDFREDTHVWHASGSWEVFGGRDNPPPDWPVIIGIDVGGGDEGDPWAIVLIAVGPDGSLYQFAEVYGTGLRVEPISWQVHGFLEGHSLSGMAYDYAQRAAAQELGEYGLHGVPAIKEITPGLMKTAQYMHIDGRLEHPFLGGRKGAPRYFVSDRCQHTIKELSAYKWGKDRAGRPTGLPSHENSHLPDAIRYAIHTFRPEARELPIISRHENPNLSPASREYWRYEDQRDKALADKGRKVQTYQEFVEQRNNAPRRFKRPSMIGRFNRPQSLK